MMNMRQPRNLHRVTKRVLILPLLLLITACGTPAIVKVANVVDATAAPTQPTAAVSPTDFVAAWILFGTPTPAPSSTRGPEPTQSTAVSAAATQVQPTVITASPTQTPALASPTPQVAYAGAQTGVQAGNAAEGQHVFTTVGC